jgi:predicted nucleotidyltransferase
VERLSATCEIEFILPFGSATRGGWRRGVSDGDLVIQTLRQGGERGGPRIAEVLFWELDDRCGTGFKEVCSIGGEGTVLEKAIKRGGERGEAVRPF